MSHCVTLKWDPTWQALEWAKEHCPSYITNDASYVSAAAGSRAEENFKYITHVDYYFSDERDSILFTLRWV